MAKILQKSKAPDKSRLLNQKILLAGNTAMSLRQLSHALSHQGAYVVRCTSGLDVLRRLADENPDLLITTSDLVDLDGYTLAALMKSSPDFADLPIIIIDKGRTNRTQLPGVADYESSFPDPQLLDKIEQLINEAPETSWNPNQQFTLPGSYGNQESPTTLTILNELILERLVSKICLSLLEVTAQKDRFLDLYFSSLARLFAGQLTGIVIAHPTTPWAAFELGDATEGDSFEKLIQQVNSQLSLGKGPSLELRGAPLTPNGKPIPAYTTVLIPGEEAQPLGALLISTAGEKPSDNIRQLVVTYLQRYMKPVMRSLCASPAMEMFHKGEEYRASTDALTGLYNLEFLVGFLQQQLLFSHRQRSPVGLLLLNIDDFSGLNEKFGKETGDHILVTLSSRLVNLTRSSDLIARYGADEFAVVLPNTNLHGTSVLADKIRLEIAQMPFGEGSKTPRVTVSVGCAEFNMEDLNPETILASAKQALTKAKTAGKNRAST